MCINQKCAGTFFEGKIKWKNGKKYVISKCFYIREYKIDKYIIKKELSTVNEDPLFFL